MQTETTPDAQGSVAPQKKQAEQSRSESATPFETRMLAKMEKSLMFVRELIPDWAENVDRRRGKRFMEDSDYQRYRVTIDWSATKAKQAQLFSVVPTVMLKAKKPQWGAGVHVFGKKLNETITLAGAGAAMDETLPDTINAAGIGVVLVSHEARMGKKTVPAVGQLQAQMLQAAGQQVPTQEVEVPVSTRTTIERVSPADFLSPVEFEGSDFDDAHWVGRRGRTTWEDARSRFNLSDDDKEDVVGQDPRDETDKLTDNDSAEGVKDADLVSFKEMFYWRYLYHKEETSFDAVQHIVWIDGLGSKPVINEPWKGQQVLEDGTVLGSRKRPLRVLTLTYISDESIPPSDSAMGRPQVLELERSRHLSFLQRETSLPMRWMDVNRVDPLVQEAIMRGTWQRIIPVIGDGARAIGETARASYPQDDFRFDQILKGDLSETWQVSASQMGGNSGPAIRSASEANIMQANFQTRIGYERARVVSFFCGIAEVVAGYLSLYGQWDEEESQKLADLPLKALSNCYLYEVRADATVLLDANQRFEKLERFLNIAVKSGFVNPKPIIVEMAQLSGLDPDEVVVDPQPGKVDGANVSLRGELQEVVMNPVLYAMLKKTGQAPSPEEIEAAKHELMAAAGPPKPPQSGPAPGGDAQPPADPTEDAHPDWNEASRINKRLEDGK